MTKQLDPRRFDPRPFVVALALVATLTQAATITVTTDSGADINDANCSVREAIVAANTNAAYHGCGAGSGIDRIVFALATPATILLEDNLPILTESLSIRGPGADLMTLDGQDLHQLLVFDSVADGELLVLETLSLIGGYAHAPSAGYPEHGGALYIASGEAATLRQVVVASNRALNGGGAIAIEGNSVAPTALSLDECWIDDNQAIGPSGGGGIFATYADLTIERTTISHNRADHQNGVGGGLRLQGSNTSIQRTTISGNSASSSGGGIYASNAIDVQLALHDSTVTLNQADADGNGLGDGGGLALAPSAGTTLLLELGNTILAENIDAGVAVKPDASIGIGVTLSSVGFNLVGSNEGSSSTFVAGSPNGDGDWIGAAGAELDPRLDALAADGGFAPTHRPTASPSSLTIDHGWCTGSGSDQRGHGTVASHQRIVDTGLPDGPGSDGCDIGAYERGGDPGAEPTIFVDGFEGGHTLSWTAEAP